MPKTPPPPSRTPKARTDRSRAFIDNLKKRGGRLLRCALEPEPTKALELIMRKRKFKTATDAVEAMLLEEALRLFAPPQNCVDINTTQADNAVVENKDKEERDMPDLKLLHGDGNPAMNNFFKALLEDDFETAEKIKREQILPLQNLKKSPGGAH